MVCNVNKKIFSGLMILSLTLFVGCDSGVFNKYKNEYLAEKAEALVEDIRLNPRSQPLVFGKGKYDIAGENKITPLTLAMKNNDKELFKFLLNEGADPNFRQSPYTDTPTAYAATLDDIFFLNYLLNGWVSIDEVGVEGTAILAAISFRQWENMDLLISKGADINSMGESNFQTPLMALATNGHYEKLLYLLEKGADYKVITPMGYTLAHDLQEYGNEGPLKSKVENFLIQRGVDLSLPMPPKKPQEFERDFEKKQKEYFRDVEAYNKIITEKIGVEATINPNTGLLVSIEKH